MRDEIILLLGGAFLSIQGWHLVTTQKNTNALTKLIEEIKNLTERMYIHEKEIERLKYLRLTGVKE